MARKQKRYHYIYKTTCSITGKYYVGMHSTDNLEDGYIGSGKRLWLSINKHGREHHSKEILEFLESRKALKDRETQLVNEDVLKDPMCMNLHIGGGGGFNGEDHKKKYVKAGSIAGIKRIQELKNDPIWKERIRKERSGRWKNENYRELMLAVSKRSFKEKHHTDESKKKISDKAKEHTGNKNSQFGTQWITNGIENKKIKKTDLLPENWKIGRFIKKKW